MRKPTRDAKTSVTWTIHLDVMEHAFILIGLQSVRWGGDPRVDPLFVKMHDKLRERASDLLAEMVRRGDVEDLDPPALRRAKAEVAALELTGSN